MNCSIFMVTNFHNGDSKIMFFNYNHQCLCWLSWALGMRMLYCRIEIILFLRCPLLGRIYGMETKFVKKTEKFCFSQRFVNFCNLGKWKKLLKQQNQWNSKSFLKYIHKFFVLICFILMNKIDTHHVEWIKLILAMYPDQK